MEARAPGQCSPVGDGTAPAPVPQLNGHRYGPCCLGRSNYTMANLPDTKACIHPSHRQRADESKNKRKNRPCHGLGPLLGPRTTEPGQGPSEGDIGLEAAPAAQYGPPRARGRRIELAPRGSSATGQPSLIQIASPTFTPTARLEPNGKYIRVVRIPFSLLPYPRRGIPRAPTLESPGVPCLQRGALGACW